MNTFIINMLSKINALQNTEKIKLVIISVLFFSMALTPLILNQSVQAGGGLKVNVHVNSAGKICVSSSGENLGCKSSDGPDMVQFEFDEGEVEVGDKFKACFKGKCVTGTNGPEKAPEDVYISSGAKTGVKNPINELPQEMNENIKKTISTTTPNLRISSVSDYSTGNYFYIVGEVMNEGTREKQFVRISLTMYDDSNIVIGTAFTYANPSDIPAGGTAPFKISVGSSDVADIGAIKSYRLLVSSS